MNAPRNARMRGAPRKKKKKKKKRRRRKERERKREKEQNAPGGCGGLRDKAISRPTTQPPRLRAAPDNDVEGIQVLQNKWEAGGWWRGEGG
jgi:hypothetical protein